jgi:multidrug efflux pump subunit AcrA (membrane-fusion protein)
MYATANVITRPVADAIQVPREAVIDTGDRQIVFIAKADGHFEPRNVKMGVVGDDDRVQILEGLSSGETVVTSGEFLLDVESRTNEAADKFRSGDAQAGAAMTQPAK